MNPPMAPPPLPHQHQQLAHRPNSLRRSISTPNAPKRQSVLRDSGLQNQRDLAGQSASAHCSPPKQLRRSTRNSAAVANIAILGLAENMNRMSLSGALGGQPTARTPRKPRPPPVSCETPPSPVITPPPKLQPPPPTKTPTSAKALPRRSVAKKGPGFYSEQPHSPVSALPAADSDDTDEDEDFKQPDSDDTEELNDSDELEDSEDEDNSVSVEDISGDADGDEDLDDLEDDVASVDSLDVTLAGELLARGGSPSIKRRQAGRRVSRAASSLLRDDDIRLPSRRGAGGRRSTAPIDLARQRLQARETPRSLPCREAELNTVFSFIESRLRQEGGCGGCLFISGVPGTGKTATVMEALRSVAELPDLPEFDKVLVNGMKVTEPRRVYSAIVRQLHKIRAPWQAALRRLKSEFTGPGRRPCVLLVDELDMLCTKRQDVLYNLFDWPQHPDSRLIVLAIANTMDLPERVLMHRVASRLGLSRLVFQAYSHQQLEDIVRARLSGLGIFEDQAVEMAARKVAAVSGDARRALDLCSRSCDLAEQESGGAYSMERLNLQVGMKHVNRAIQEMFTGPVVAAVSRQLSEYERLLMRAVLAVRLRTGRDENPAGQVWCSARDIARAEGLDPPSWPVVCVNLACLSSMRLLLWDGGHRGLVGRVLLNCSPQDVELGLRETQQQQQLLQSAVQAVGLPAHG